uniref:Uncharacterized protein n=1 Tax=uncultured Desulfobacterium sp. TaxID=201089 RepID=E1YH64_9BACT|nr:unknown protein [uncultured Desulfobacterium sp.]
MFQAGNIKVAYINRCPIKQKIKVLGAIAGANLFRAEVGANEIQKGGLTVFVRLFTFEYIW